MSLEPKYKLQTHTIVCGRYSNNKNLDNTLGLNHLKYIFF